MKTDRRSFLAVLLAFLGFHRVKPPVSPRYRVDFDQVKVSQRFADAMAADHVIPLRVWTPDSVALAVLGLPEATKDDTLDRIRKADPGLHAAVLTRIKAIRQSVA